MPRNGNGNNPRNHCVLLNCRLFNKFLTFISQRYHWPVLALAIFVGFFSAYLERPTIRPRRGAFTQATWEIFLHSDCILLYLSADYRLMDADDGGDSLTG